MNEPRPAMISARPPESRSSVAKSWKTRTGSSELSTLTALVSRIVRRALGGRGEHDGGRRHGEVGAVMLADAEDVETDLVGELDLLDEVAQTCGRIDRAARHRVGGQLGEGVEPEFHPVSLIERSSERAS